MTWLIAILLLFIMPAIGVLAIGWMLGGWIGLIIALLLCCAD